jgi:hypothetical protein
MNTPFAKKFDKVRIPPLAGLSIGLSLLQGVPQVWWRAIRYSSFGPRPLAAKLFIIGQGIVLMFVMVEGVSAWRLSDKDSDKPFSLMRTPKVRPFGGSLLWMVVAIAAWILATFVLG